MNSNAPDMPTYTLVAVAALSTIISAFSIRALYRELLDERRMGLPVNK